MPASMRATIDPACIGPRFPPPERAKATVMAQSSESFAILERPWCLDDQAYVLFGRAGPTPYLKETIASCSSVGFASPVALERVEVLHAPSGSQS